MTMEANSVQSAHTISVQVVQSRHKSLTLRIEPWGSQYDMPSGIMFEIVMQGPLEGIMMIEYTSESIIAYGWAGSTFTLFREGIRITP